MNMIEKFLEGKDALREDIDKIREDAMKAASDRTDARIDEFVEGVKEMVARATDSELVEFITSGKLEDDDIMAAISFRAQLMSKTHTGGMDNAVAGGGIPVRAIVVGGI